MTWKHVCVIALAIALVLLCGSTHNACATNPAAFSGVLQLASTIIGGAVGHAMRDSGITTNNKENIK